MSNLFVLLIQYTAPLERIDSVLAQHRGFLQTGYDKGFLLASGPRTPREGGVIIGKFADRAAAESFSKQDPFVQQNLVRYEILEFTPVLHNALLTSFLQ
ncbi:MAG: YciI family protein [Helicobacter sp.]|nr:YciI family protein [Helicobacter sp.]